MRAAMSRIGAVTADWADVVELTSSFVPTLDAVLAHLSAEPQAQELPEHTTSVSDLKIQLGVIERGKAPTIYLSRHTALSVYRLALKRTYADSTGPSK